MNKKKTVCSQTKMFKWVLRGLKIQFRNSRNLNRLEFDFYFKSLFTVCWSLDQIASKSEECIFLCAFNLRHSNPLPSFRFYAHFHGFLIFSPNCSNILRQKLKKWCCPIFPCHFMGQSIRWSKWNCAHMHVNVNQLALVKYVRFYVQIEVSRVVWADVWQVKAFNFDFEFSIGFDFGWILTVSSTETLPYSHWIW